MPDATWTEYETRISRAFITLNATASSWGSHNAQFVVDKQLIFPPVVGTCSSLASTGDFYVARSTASELQFPSVWLFSEDLQIFVNNDGKFLQENNYLGSFINRYIYIRRSLYAIDATDDFLLLVPNEINMGSVKVFDIDTGQMIIDDCVGTITEDFRAQKLENGGYDRCYFIDATGAYRIFIDGNEISESIRQMENVLRNAPDFQPLPRGRPSQFVDFEGHQMLWTYRGVTFIGDDMFQINYTNLKSQWIRSVYRDTNQLLYVTYPWFDAVMEIQLEESFFPTEPLVTRVFAPHVALTANPDPNAQSVALYPVYELGITHVIVNPLVDYLLYLEAWGGGGGGGGGGGDDGGG